ncbi:S-adenosyl-L-methionine-dependent methyltransferase [Lophiotrema nucula]|uniref:S-adenosyl-L-methionine-dependent methyltransferase n=1 Tax=Lophiotrema nucula TaxID=690887 RepID=A0A6A5ZE26_9PLEO|nr:S-adenosyl-L-methionine-dependent methyltransferase [Lophiotrema nucula]
MSLSEANRKYFDSISDAYDNKPWFTKVNQQVTEELQARLEWIGIPLVNTGSPTDVKEVKFLDYACGPGLMSRIFGPYVTVTKGIDISPNMVATYNARARTAGLPVFSINAVMGDLFNKNEAPSSEISGSEFRNFDLVAVGFGFHHFEDVVHAARCLKERLRPGGVLVINDFLEGGDLKADEHGNPIAGTEGDHAHHHHHPGHHRQSHHHGHDGIKSEKCDPATHTHANVKQEWDDVSSSREVKEQMKDSIAVYSFTVDGVKKFFTEAGFVDVDVAVMPERVYMQFGGRKIWRTILFAKGRKPLETEAKSEL